MKGIRNIAVGLTVAIWANLALAQEDLVIYPSQGQDQEQQSADEYQCYGWAKDRSSFDPMARPTASRPPPRKKAPKGGAGVGALRGAVLGGIIGGSSGAKKGAGAGLVFGGARRADQKRQQQQAEKQWEQEQARQYNQVRNTYNRNFAACMQGRGYTVG